MNKPIVILDRDGVINFESAQYIKSPDEWIAIPGSLQAIADLNQAGFKVLVVTNQSGVGRGFYSLEVLNNIHDKLVRELAALGGVIEEFYYCPHHPDDKCGCRKPKPGLLHQIKEKYAIDFNEVFFIGDSWTDVLVAREVGCKPILVLTGNGERTLANHSELAREILCFANLREAVNFLTDQGWGQI